MSWQTVVLILGGIIGVIFTIHLIIRIASAAYFKSKKDFLNTFKNKSKEEK